MSKDTQQAMAMIAGAVIGWLIGEYWIGNPAWELSCLVIGSVLGQFGFKLATNFGGQK